MSKKKVIVIGAGPAGLTFGYEILKDGGSKEYDVTILEESNDIEYIGFSKFPVKVYFIRRLALIWLGLTSGNSTHFSDKSLVT